MKRLLYLVVGALHLTSIAQPFPFKQVDYIGAERGLQGYEVSCITQDKNGFIWVITEHALNRFDGYSFKAWAYNPKDSNSIITGFYNGLVEDQSGVLWIPSNVHGLYSFDPYREKFSHFRHNPKDRNSLADNNIYAVAPDPAGGVWISSARGLDHYDPKKKEIRHVTAAKAEDNRIRYALQLNPNHPSNKGQNLWMLTNAPGIDCFDTYSWKKIKSVTFPFPAKPGQCMANSSLVLTGYNKERIWIGSDHNGIYGFDVRKEEYFHIPSEKICTTTRHLSGYHKVFEDHQGNLWTTNDYNEIVYYDRNGKRFYYYEVQKKEIDFQSLVPVIWQDKSGKIWICTNSGLITVDTRQKKIVNCIADKNPGSIAGNMVFAIERINDSQLVVTSDKVQVFNKTTNSFSPFPLMENGKELRARGIWDVYRDKKGILWFTGWPGIISYDETKKESRRYDLHTSSGRKAFNGCVGMMEDNLGRYWAPSWGEGLYLFNPDNGEVKPFSVHEGPNSISTNFVSTIFKDSKGLLYINGWDGGFISFDPEKELFKIYHHNSNDSSSVSYENCHSFIETDDGLIWFGTMGGGINVFDPAREKFRAFTKADGLVHDNVSSLVKDKKGRFWAGTRAGLSCFIPPKNPFDQDIKIRFRNYDKSDGISTNVINPSVSFCDTDGTLYFGTRDGGMFYFHPDDLLDNNFVPPVFITELRVMNQIILPYQQDSLLKVPIEYASSIKLDYKRNMLSFGFSALNFIHPEKNKYAYMLEGYDKDWIYTDASRRFVTYTNLDAGKYVFKVKGSNNDEIWNERPAELTIMITPPFWRTWWFQTLLALAIGMMIYGIYRYRIGELMKLQMIRNNIASDLHDDMGSTLNSISIYSEVARQQAGKDLPALTLIGENARKIIDSMSDIVWTINPENDSFDKIIARMRSFSYNLLKAKEVEYSFEVDENLKNAQLPMLVRKNFYLIFKEAINNLVKYSGASSVLISLYEKDKEIVLSIYDNGIGIAENHESQGNGLMNMKKRAKEIRAHLRIETAIGKGTKIELRLRR